MIYKRSVTRKVLNIQQIPGSNMEIRNDNDRRLWFRIKSIDKKLDGLGKIGSKNFDWLTWENLTDESARLYSELSVMDDILKVVRNQMRK
jgi:hypothetical protein